MHATFTMMASSSSTGSKPLLEPLLEVACGGCGCAAPDRKLLSCSRCHLSKYCSTRCQRSAYRAHVPLCLEAASASGGRSYLACARNCARALRCFWVLGVTEAVLHPLQRWRLGMLHEVVEHVARGALPPPAYPCFNCCCPNAADLLQYSTEQQLREFVISGLCALCTERMFAGLKALAGPDEPPPPPDDPPPRAQGPCLWEGGAWLPVRDGTIVRCVTTLWGDAEKEDPVWVAGETVQVQALWECISPADGFAQLVSAGCEPPQGPPRPAVGDGEVTFESLSGRPRTRTLPAHVFRRRAQQQELVLGCAATIPEMRGCISPGYIRFNSRHDGTGLPWDRPLLMFGMLTRVCGLNLAKTLCDDVREPHCPATAALMRMMLDDEERRADGTFERFYQRSLGSRRRPAPAAAAANGPTGGGGAQHAVHAAEQLRRLRFGL